MRPRQAGVLAIWLIGPVLLKQLFGNVYASAVPIMLMHAVSLPFIFMRQGFSRWILISRMARFSVISHGAGALLNVGLNLWLIPHMGGMGAAVSTVASYVVASYLSLLFLPQTRSSFWAMSRALLQPWRAGLNVFSMLRRATKG